MEFRPWGLGIPFPMPVSRDNRRGGERRDDRDEWTYRPLNMGNLAMISPFSPRIYDDSFHSPEWGTPLASPAKNSSAGTTVREPRQLQSRNRGDRDGGAGHACSDRGSSKGRSSGISFDFALQQLHHQLAEAEKIFKDCLEQHDQDTGGAKKYADESTLNWLWRDLLNDKFKDKNVKQHFDGLASEIRRTMGVVRDAQPVCRRKIAAGKEADGSERDARAVRKLQLACNEVTELIPKSTRQAGTCRELLSEIAEAIYCLMRARQIAPEGRILPMLHHEIPGNNGNDAGFQAYGTGPEDGQNGEFGHQGDKTKDHRIHLTNILGNEDWGKCEPTVSFEATGPGVEDW